MNRKRRLLLFCFIVLAAITFLASSLHDVHFQAGRSLSILTSSQPPVIFQAPALLSDTPLWKILIFWLAFIVNLFLLFYLLPPELRKRIIRQAFGFSVGILILFIALRYRLLQLPNLDSEPVNNTGQSPPGLNSNPFFPPFQPPKIAPWLMFLISLGVFLGLLILSWIFYRWWMKSHARRYSSLDDIAEIARSSLNDLDTGHEMGDVIIQSYARMSMVVNVKRGIQRPEAATPREFAVRLEKAGLPADAVNRLTRLFESARYGTRKSNPSDINEAVACLNSILQACGAAQ
jgi:hypothetical protein